jgi:hypothetical protein
VRCHVFPRFSHQQTVWVHKSPLYSVIQLLTRILSGLSFSLQIMAVVVLSVKLQSTVGEYDVQVYNIQYIPVNDSARTLNEAYI